MVVNRARRFVAAFVFFFQSQIVELHSAVTPSTSRG